MPSEQQLHEIFEQRARETPRRIAVRVGADDITYGELNARANVLAARLRDLDVCGDSLVGLCVDRSTEMIVGLLGILKAGGAYVPIDPGYPKKRIDFLVADSGSAVVVTTSRSLECVRESGATLVRVGDRVRRKPARGGSALAGSGGTARNLAYVIYTSGSTGVPKGVLIEHRNVVRLFEQTDHWFHFSERDVWMMFHSISFDFSVWEIWGALLYGGTLVIVPSAVARSPEQLQALIRKEHVTVLCQTPTAFQQFVAAECRHPIASGYPLRLVIFGGEALDLKTLRPWAERYGLDRPALINMYGITETTVHVTYKRIAEDDLVHPELSLIGTPIPDLDMHLLDDAGRPVPDGAPGEIFVGGAGVARGYLNRPELTAQRFVVQPDGTRLYRSGDRASRLPNGDCVYLGRADDQIKVRGFRVEPREIELCLAEHPAIGSVCLLARDYGGGDVRLFAFAVGRPGLTLTPAAAQQIRSDLTARAASELPLHMRPSAYFVLAELPITAHGKVDREELLRIASRPESSESMPAAFTTTTEQMVSAVCEEILQRPGIGLHDDLFDVGATSLALMRILVRVNEYFRVSLNGSELGEQTSISRLAECVDDARGQTHDRHVMENNDGEPIADGRVDTYCPRSA